MRRIVPALLVSLCLVGCGQPKTSNNPPAQSKIWTEEELAPLVKGKRAKDVIAVLGKPDRTVGDPEKDEEAIWNYWDRLKSPYKDEPDFITVRFANGVASEKVR